MGTATYLSCGMDDCGFPPKEDEIEMVLKARIRLSQSKKAWTQYITIPSAVVQDSQYPFKENEELHLEVEPSTGVMVISQQEREIKVTKEGLFFTHKEKGDRPIEVIA
jgi:hypothetical protein